MGRTFIIFVVALTSVIAYRATPRTFRPSEASMRKAVRALFEWIGATALFFVLNIAAGAAIVVLIRTFTQRFVNFYELESVLLLVLSAVQGFLFQRWWNGG